MTDRMSIAVSPVTRNLFPLWFLDSAENVGSKPIVTQHVSPSVLRRHGLHMIFQIQDISFPHPDSDSLI